MGIASVLVETLKTSGTTEFTNCCEQSHNLWGN
jgi:hypothetical protein